MINNMKNNKAINAILAAIFFLSLDIAHKREKNETK